MEQVRLVRIHRYNPHQGYVRSQYKIRVGKSFLKFDAMQPEWVRVSKEIADILARERQQPNSKMSPPLFEIQTEAGALAVEAAEKAAREAKKRILQPTVATAKDMTNIGVEGRGDLSIEEVVASRKKALEASRSSEGKRLFTDSETLEEPVEKPKKKKKSSSSDVKNPKKKSKKLQ